MRKLKKKKHMSILYCYTRSSPVVLIIPLFFKTVFLKSFRFTATLNGMYRDFPYISCPHKVQPLSTSTPLTRPVHLLELLNLC